MTANIRLSLVPMRKNDSETSEMISQLLFGERVDVLELDKNWLYVRSRTDNYEGWVTRKMVEIETTDSETIQNSIDPYRVITPFTIIYSTEYDTKMLLPGGSILENIVENKIIIRQQTFEVNPRDISNKFLISGSLITNYSKQFLNIPYLWGGKSALGIDCSGFVQVVFSMCGLQLPRDASQQVEIGKTIDFLFEAQEGDLAFFVNAEGKVIHVGILLNSSQIIHASGWVKIENIDATGIISSLTGEYTHFLKTIKRLIF